MNQLIFFHVKVSRHNFVDHYRREQMIVSKEGTVRGIRHRVSKIKMDIMDSLHMVEDRRLIDHEALLGSESGQCVVYLTSLGTSQHFS